MELYKIKETSEGIFTIMLDVCTNNVLKTLLNPEVPFVWSVNHFIEDGHEWTYKKIALSKNGPLHNIKTRGLQFDFFIETQKYLEILDEFEHQGNILLQCQNKIPQSLRYIHHSNESRFKILKNNDIYSEFYLPHSNENASFTCTDKDHIEIIVKKLSS